MARVGLTKAGLCALMLLTVGIWEAPAPAQSAAPGRRVVGATAPWKIAGVGLGMTPAQVARAVKEDGWRLTQRSQGLSWDGHVAHQAPRRSSGKKIPAAPQVIEREDYEWGDEQMRVTYQAGRSGPYVSQVDYSIGSEAIETDKLRSVVLAKYGKPSLRWESELLYCAAGEPQCSRTGSLVTNQLPNLTVYLWGLPRHYLHLRQGQRADKAYDAAIRAEAERLYPRANKTTF